MIVGVFFSVRKTGSGERRWSMYGPDGRVLARGEACNATRAEAAEGAVRFKGLLHREFCDRPTLVEVEPTREEAA